MEGFRLLLGLGAWKKEQRPALHHNKTVNLLLISAKVLSKEKISNHSGVSMNPIFLKSKGSELYSKLLVFPPYNTALCNPLQGIRTPNPK